VGTETITADDLLTEVYRTIPGGSRKISSSDRRMLLNSLIRMKVLVMSAKRDGIDVSKVSSGVPADVAVAALYRRTLESRLRATDQEVMAFYRRHQDHYAQPLQTGYRLIAPTLALAQKAQTLLKAGVSFQEVASRLGLVPKRHGAYDTLVALTLALTQDAQILFKTGVSIHRIPNIASRLRMVRKIYGTYDTNEIPPFRRGEHTLPFERVFFALQPGQSSEIVPVPPFGYEILQRGQPKPPASDSEVQEAIRSRLTNDAVENKIKDLVNQAPVHVNEDNLANLQ
jgi:hypothetical protein